MKSNRRKKEKEIVEQMVRLYCRQKEGNTSLCPQCQEMIRYAHAKLNRCVWADRKPTCAKCPFHCYTSERRNRIRSIMRYAGPRMPLHHPIAAIRYLLWSRKRLTT